MVAWRYEFYLLVLKNVSLVRAIYNNRTANGKNKKLTGYPQGSLFGPLLWNLFQNDLLLHRQLASLFMYDDDHQIYTYDNDVQKTAQTLRRQTETVPQWFKDKSVTASQPSKVPDLNYWSKKTPGYAWRWNSMDMKSNYLIISGFSV